MKRIFPVAGLLLAAMVLLMCSSCCKETEVESTGEAYMAKAIFSAGSSETALADESEGAMLFRTKTCFTCHGAKGQTPLLPYYPMIAGQNHDYLLRQMLDIKSGARSNGQTAAMKAVIQLVSEDEIAVLAEYIATELVREGYEAPDSINPRGKKLFRRRTCFTCHGKDAKTPIMPDYPKIAGQNKEYALQQMTDIKSGARNNGQTISMKGIIHLVNEEEMAVLAEYISTLEP